MKPAPLAWWMWVVVVLCVIAIPRLVYGASFSMTTTTGDSIRLTDTPCEVSSGWLKLWKAAVHYRGQDYDACWVLIGDTVVIFDSAGDISPVPKTAFHRDTAV